MVSPVAHLRTADSPSISGLDHKLELPEHVCMCSAVLTLDCDACAGRRCCGCSRAAAGTASCAARPQPLPAHARADSRLSSGSFALSA